MKTSYTHGAGKIEYLAPMIETLEVSTEQGFAASVEFGTSGFPGSDPDNNEFGPF